MMNLHDIHIFTAGDRISSAGSKSKFTEKDLDEMVKNYDPSLHEAPLQLGHGKPKDNEPAYGWVKGLKRKGSKLYASVDFTDAGTEVVKSKGYKKRSSSFYRPDSEINPKPGEFYLRHLALLGASPPAVKGLEEFAFSEAGEDDYEAMEVETEQMTEDDMDMPTEIDAKSPKEEMEEAMEIAKVERELEEAAAEAEAQAQDETPESTDDTATPSESDEVEEAPVEKEMEVTEDMDEPEPETTTPEIGDEPEDTTDAVAAMMAELDAVKAQMAAHKEAADAEMAALREEVEAEKMRAKEAMQATRSMELESEVDEIYSEARLTTDIISKEDLMAYVEGVEFGTIEFAEGETAGSKLLALLKRLPPAVEFGEVVPDAEGEDSKGENEEPEDMMEPDHVKAAKMAAETGMSFAECLKRTMFPEYYEGDTATIMASKSVDKE